MMGHAYGCGAPGVRCAACAEEDEERRLVAKEASVVVVTVTEPVVSASFSARDARPGERPGLVLRRSDATPESFDLPPGVTVKLEPVRERFYPTPGAAVETNCTRCGARCWLVNVEETGVEMIDIAPVTALVPADEQGLWTVRAAYRLHECPEGSPEELAENTE